MNGQPAHPHLARDEKCPGLGVMLCGCLLEILNDF